MSCSTPMNRHMHETAENGYWSGAKACLIAGFDLQKLAARFMVCMPTIDVHASGMMAFIICHCASSSKKACCQGRL